MIWTFITFANMTRMIIFLSIDSNPLNDEESNRRMNSLCVPFDRHFEVNLWWFSPSKSGTRSPWLLILVLVLLKVSLKVGRGDISTPRLEWVSLTWRSLKSSSGCNQNQGPKRLPMLTVTIIKVVSAAVTKHGHGHTCIYFNRDKGHDITYLKGNKQVNEMILFLTIKRRKHSSRRKSIFFSSVCCWKIVSLSLFAPP